MRHGGKSLHASRHRPFRGSAGTPNPTGTAPVPPRRSVQPRPLNHVHRPQRQQRLVLRIELVVVLEHEVDEVVAAYQAKVMAVAGDTYRVARVGTERDEEP